MQLGRDLAIATGALAAAIGLIALAIPDDVGSAPGQAFGAIRRLTQDEYRTTIADLFGADIALPAGLEPDRRDDGLLRVGASRVGMTGSGAEQYEAASHAVAALALAPGRRERLLACRPADPTAPDDRCAAEAIATIGRRLYRRPLTQAELAAQVRTAHAAAETFGDFHVGVEASLASMLMAPEFLFLIERGERRGGMVELDGYSRAQRLSYFLWNAPPDEALLRAAQMGDLGRPAGLRRQVDRLMASPRFATGARAFFGDWLRLQEAAAVEKDARIYPKWDAATAAEAREQTLRLVTDHLVRQDLDFRLLLTTDRTPMTPRLAALYRAPAPKADWDIYAFPPEDGRGGLLGQVGFLSSYAHPGRSSPTRRGVAIRETLLCEAVSPPPPDVDFSLMNDVANPQLPTARDRLAQHVTDPTCAGCHAAADPLGVALENFDGSGEYRPTENGAVIDATGEHRGTRFVGLRGLSLALAADPGVSSCFVRRYYSYGVGRRLTPLDEAAMQPLDAAFRKDGSYRKLARAIATSPAFYRTPAAAAEAAR